MALMPDEQYVMISDSIEKKKIAHSSHNRKTHCGKGGRVKFPSDYLSKKELKAMNGDVKSYNLNKPMTWEEFRSMPQDLQIMYIKKLRNEFGVPDSVLGKAMGVCRSSFSKAMKDLKLSLGKSAGATGRQWFGSEKSSKFSEYWNKFNKKEDTVEEDSVEEKNEAVEEMDISEEKSNDYTMDDADELVHYGTKYNSGKYPSATLDRVAESEHITIPEPSQSYYLAHDLDKYAVSSTNEPDHITIPTGGRLSFDCKFDDAVKVLESILSGTNVRLNVDWIVVKGD